MGVAPGLAAERCTWFPQYASSPDRRYLAFFTWDTAAAVRAVEEHSRKPFVFDPTTTLTALDVTRTPNWRSVPVHPELWIKDLRTGRTARAWQSPGTLQVVADPSGTVPPELAWSPDGKTVAILDYPPLREGEYLRKHLGIYVVATQSFRTLIGDDLGETIHIKWLPDGTGLTMLSEGRIGPDRPRHEYQNYEYRFADSSFRALPELPDLAEQSRRAIATRVGGFTSLCKVGWNRRRVACRLETPTTPPEIAVADVDADGQLGSVRVITALNPEYRVIRIGEVGRITWSGRNGVEGSATLVRPLDFASSRRYPLLVMLYNQGTENAFVYQAGSFTSWPVQAFAARGYAVLLVNFPTSEFTPGDFEGARWAEAEGPVANVDSAVQRVVRIGIADTTRMGILGWSWGAYVASYLISHYPHRFQVAAAGEGGLYETSAYWLAGNQFRAFLAAPFGGGPYPRYLSKWTAMAPAMNAHRIRDPLLQEYSTKNLSGLELYTAIVSQGGAAEMVFYPDEVHIFEGPRNRLHSMHLNYDWFNFWLLGEEDPDPAKAEQYARWRELRKLQQQPAADSAAPRQ